MRTLEPLVPAGGAVATGAAKVKGEAKGSDKQVAIVQKLLLAFGAIALFVGAFVIFNTFSITIAQRTRELATLRTLGASRRQVLASVIAESLAIGLLGSVGGLLLGLGLDRGLAALSAAAGNELPDSGAVLATRTVVVCLLAGVLITLVAGLFPALRATRVPPIAAVREGATLPPSRLARHVPRIAAAAIALGAGVIAVGLFADGLGATADARAARGRVPRPVRRRGDDLDRARQAARLDPRLARLSASPARPAGSRARTRSAIPSRTAATAAALMIYLALVTFVAVIGQGMRSSVADGVDRVVTADYVVTADDNVSPLPPAVGEALAAGPARDGQRRPARLGARLRVRRVGRRARPGHDRPRRPARLGRRLRGEPRAARRRRRRAPARLRGRPRAAPRQPLRRRDRPGPQARAHGQGDLHAARGRRDPGPDRHLARDVRRRLRTAAGRLHVRQRGWRRRRRARSGHPALPGGRAADAQRVPRRPREADPDDADRRLRPARDDGDREPAGDGEHARPHAVRANARARDAARRRDDAPAGPADDPPRERHHRPDRRRARAAARDRAGRARDPGALRHGHRVRRPRSAPSPCSRSPRSSPASSRRSSRRGGPRA